MALANYSLPFGGGVGLSSHNWATISPLQQHATAVNNLLYGPAGHQESDNSGPDRYYKNDPYAPPPPLSAQQQFRNRNNNYLPPPPSQQTSPQFTAKTQQSTRNQFAQTQTTRTYGENSYSNSPSLPPQRNIPVQQLQQSPQPAPQYFNNFNSRRVTYTPTPPTETVATPQPPIIRNRNTIDSSSPSGAGGNGGADGSVAGSDSGIGDNPLYPHQGSSFTRVQAGSGSRTQVHAVLDYDDDGGEEEYMDEDDGTGMLRHLFCL